METVFNIIDDHAWFSSDDRKWINKIRKLKQSHPDDIEMIAEPETNDGCIYCKINAKWLRIQPPIKRELTVEQRAAAADRLKNSHITRQNPTNKKDG